MIPQYHWISVGGNDSEPAILRGGLYYTIGCADGHTKAGIRDFGLILKHPDEMTDAEAERYKKAWDAQRAREIKAGKRRPGYRDWSREEGTQ